MKPNTVRISDCILPTRQIDPRKWDGEFTYIDISSINRDTKRIEGAKVLATADAPSRARKEIRKNDILVSTVRPNLNAVALIEEEPPRPIGSTGFAVLRPDVRKVHPHYLFYRVVSNLFISDMVSQAKGAGYPAVSDRIVGEHRLPLPPLSEQHRIIEILDQADALRRQRRQADLLSQRILPALFHEMFEAEGWPMKPLSEILNSIQGGWSPVCENRPPEDNEWGVLKLGAATYCEYRPSESKTLRSDCEPRAELEVRKGDLLFTRKNTRDLVGATAYVFETPPRLMTPDLIFRLVPKLDQIDPIYLWQAMIEPKARMMIQAQASGAAASMVNISQSRLLPLELPIPPLQLQQKFASAVLTFRESTRSQVASATTLETLFQTLLHRAFDGSLTAKWREGQANDLLQEMEHQARI